MLHEAEAQAQKQKAPVVINVNISTPANKTIFSIKNETKNVKKVIPAVSNHTLNVTSNSSVIRNMT